ncbi:MAG: hypothetical protein HYT62_05365, partial [Candidatus Yanofskybacteria bacterium]|nr:hypothetical protein [Candidatus Yanofskybacteria bacterium]
MAASDATLDSDFAALRAKGFDGIRMFTDWNPKDNPYQLMDPSGNIRPGRMAALINVIQKASANNLMVDVSFTRDTVSGLEPNELQAGIVSVTQALMSYRNLYFDITNEADHDGTTCGGGGNARLCPTEARSIRDAVKAVDSQRIVSISPIYGNRQSYIINGGMDFTLAHSALTGMRNEVSQARASTPGLAVHMQEPDRCRTLNSCEYSVNQFLTSASDAKCSGATGWNFHTQAGYDLDNNTIFNQWLDPAVENQVANSLSSTLSGVTWFSCQGAGPTPTPGGGSATGTYRGACPAGYIALAEANASSGDPSETAGYYCDDDGIDPTVVWGVTYPVSGLLVCDNNTSSSNAFVVPSNMWPCNAGRPGNPGWSFDSSGRPLKNGNPVTFIGEHNCGSGGSTPVTITNS